MTFAPPPLLALRDLWIANGGDFLGIVGDAAHAATGGYHEGRDDLAAAGVLATDYSVQQPRDKAGLSNAAAAFDFGPINGSLVELQAFSRWLVARCQAKEPGTEDIREVIYSPDGKVVQRWSAVDGLIHAGWPTGTGNGDASHIFHTHGSYFRDSEANDKLAAVAPYFAAPPDSSTEVPMPRILNPQSASGVFTTGPNGATVFRVHDGADGPVGAGEAQTVVMSGTLEGFVDDGWFTNGAPDGELRAYAKAQGTFVGSVPPDAAEARRAQYDVDARALLGPRP